MSSPLRPLAPFNLLALFALAVVLPGSGRADEDGPPDLVTTGSLKALGEGFYELSYRQPQPKGRPKAVQAYVKVGEGTQWFADRPGALEKLEAGAELWLFGEPVEAESQTDSGQTVIDRQVRGTQALISGPGVWLPESAPDAKGARWLKASVSKPGPALEVTLGGSSYRVLLVRGCPYVLRAALPAQPEKLKKKLLAGVAGSKSDARPEKGKDTWDAFEAKHVVLLDKRLGGAYALMAPQAPR